MQEKQKANMLCGILVAVGAFCIGLLCDVGGIDVPIFWGVPPAILLALGIVALATKNEKKK